MTKMKKKKKKSQHAETNKDHEFNDGFDFNLEVSVMWLMLVMLIVLSEGKEYGQCHTGYVTCTNCHLLSEWKLNGSLPPS